MRQGTACAGGLRSGWTTKAMVLQAGDGWSAVRAGSCQRAHDRQEARGVVCARPKIRAPSRQAAMASRGVTAIERTATADQWLHHTCTEMPNDLPIPTLLTALLEAGEWPRDWQEMNAQSLRRFKREQVQRIALEESEI